MYSDLTQILDPRTKLFLMVVVSTLAIGGGNSGMMKIIHPLVCLIPFVLMLLDRNIFHLSGGQKQRLAVASAIASGREILFFDEPTSGLDLYHMKEVAEVLKFLKKRKEICLRDHT